MSEDIRPFIAAAMEIGLGARLAALIADVETAIDAYPPQADGRYLARLEAQRERLLEPDLPLVVAIVRQLCTDDPARLALVAPVALQLGADHPCLAALASSTRL